MPLITSSLWSPWIPASQQTLEHEVRYRSDDQSAVKKTWAGTFGYKPDNFIVTHADILPIDLLLTECQPLAA